jgi:hypothetical protein
VSSYLLLLLVVVVCMPPHTALLVVLTAFHPRGLLGVPMFHLRHLLLL